MKLNRSFIKGRMNKSVDERLVPEGEYIDARNVRVGSTETTDIGALEKTKGNIQLTNLQHRGQPLSSSAICIGAFEDGAEDTLYWFVHDPNQPLSPTNIVDMIVSYDVVNSTLKYLVVTETDGTGTKTALNFNPLYLINGINKIQDFIFFTDNFNEPKRINITAGYTTTAPFFQNSKELYVIKQPPLFSPTLNLINQASEINYIEDKFLAFSYRWKYKDGEYSALSPFSDFAFEPNPFRLNTDNYTNDGMLNFYNAVEVTVNSGDSTVEEIELCFKFGDDVFVRLAERLNKVDIGIGNNVDYVVTFDNSKTYTFLNPAEIGRLFDNVPRLAKAQTILGNRLMYGNYLEGYDLVTEPANTPFVADYFLEYEGNAINFNPFSFNLTSGDVYILPGTSAALNNQIISFDMTGTSFTAGTQVYFSITVQHGGWFVMPLGGLPLAPTNTGSGSFTIDINYTIPQYYASVDAFAQSQDFLDAVGTAANIQPLLSCASGGTLTDVYNCNINTNPNADWQGFVTGYLSSAGGDPIEVISTPGSNTIGFRILAANFLDVGALFPFPTMAEYLQVTSGVGFSQNLSTVRSLHSDRNYELGMEYLDEFGRATTVLTSANNSIYIPCVSSGFANRLVAKIPASQKAPNWADKYRFVLKQDRFRYQTIYTTNWYDEPGTNAVWMQLEGENQAKIEVGDFLRVKGDVDGAVRQCCTVEVLDKQVQQQNFLTGDVRSGPGLDDPIIVAEEQGVYMKLKPDCFSTDKSEFKEYTSGSVDVNSKKNKDNRIDTGSGADKYLFVNYECFDGSGATTAQWPVAEGAQVEIVVEVFRAPDKKCDADCGSRKALLDISYTSSADYVNLKEFFEGEGIIARWNNAPDNAIECLDDSGSGTCAYYPQTTGAGAPGAFTIVSGAQSEFASPNESKIQFFTVGGTGADDYLIMRVVGGYPYCSNDKPDNQLGVYVRITENPNVVAFETIPTEADVDIYYEGSQTYDIGANGEHLGIAANGDTNQDFVSGAPAEINLDFYNCFTFGNGVESYRILDSLSQQFFLLGSRTNVAIDDDYKAITRFAGVTYSGVYQDIQNVNRLNEFNLSIGNFKRLDQSFGDIQVLDGRETDLLVLQEDRISYVLAGKNLLSDSTGGGNVASVPEVLGTQIARVEKYGISHNPESYIQWGREKFFTDAKRGVVLKLDGAGQSESLSVISDLGMDSWFRDLFKDNLYTQKLGGYDPYIDEYVLHSNDIRVPIPTECTDCEDNRTVSLDVGETIEYCINLDSSVGDVDVAYDITTGESEVRAIYDGVTFTGIATTGPATLTFAKGNPLVNTVTIRLTNISDEQSVIEINVGCVDQKSLTVIMVCVTNESDQNETIHNEYNYNIGTAFLPTTSEGVVFGSSAFSPVISQYQSFVGFQGQPNIPTDSSTLNLYCNKISPDSFVFATNNKFKFLRSATLYGNNIAGIQALLADPGVVTLPTIATGAPQVYQANVVVPPDPLPVTNPAYGRYLYLIYDYRDANEIELCYELANINDVCCECATCDTLHALPSTPVNDLGALCPTSPPLNQIYYYSGSPVDPQVGDAIWADANGTTPLSQGWYKIDNDGPAGRVIYVEVIGASSIITLKQNCI
tara:strand:- start:10128 stop:14951 length:4824 start_codon:yes stop_codon:yes gene_type:complete